MRHLSGLRRLTILEAGLYAMYSADDPQRDARIASAESGELPAEFLTPLDQLRVLDLSGRAVGDVHIKHINAPHLWKVHLDNTPAGDGAAERISRLPAITVISMNATRVTDVGVCAIAQQGAYVGRARVHRGNRRCDRGPRGAARTGAVGGRKSRAPGAHHRQGRAPAMRGARPQAIVRVRRDAINRGNPRDRGGAARRVDCLP